MTALPRLMLIADQQGAGGRPLEDVIAAASDGTGGYLFVQLREKTLEDAALSALLVRIRARLPTRAPLVVNNRPRIAAALGLGLHLPAAAPSAMRASAGLRGRSVHDRAEAQQARRERVDYAVVGTIFETASHPGRLGAGLKHLRAMAAALGEMPAYAIGGITPQNAASAVAAGAWGVAVRGAVLDAADPAVAARALAEALAGVEGNSL